MTSSPWIDNANGSSSASTSTSQSLYSYFHSFTCAKHVGENILRLVAWREISPRVKRPLKRLWGEAARWSTGCSGPRCEVTDAKHGLIAWVETESLRHCSAKYCPLVPSPRSTIAAAFSPDGNTLASTHGDHTVKIISCETGNCVKVLSGHRRTPWVVRFHPIRQEILASGSLDHEVRLWDANTAECISARDFFRPIASIAFHAQGDLLAVASGHKLYIWQYNDKGDASSPMIVLRTRRSLRAVHFHPHAAPFLLTAEVNDLDAPDSPMTLATSTGYLQYPPPAVFFTPAHPGNSVSSASSAPLMPFPCFFWPDALVNENNMRGSWTDTSMIDSHARDPQAESKQMSESAGELDLQTQVIPRKSPVDARMSHAEPFPELVNPSGALENMVIGKQLDEPANDVYESGVDMLLRAAEGNASAMSCQSNSLGIAGGLEDGTLSYQTGTPGRAQPESAYLVESSSSRLPARQEGLATGEGPVMWPLNISPSMNIQLLLGNRQLHRFLPVGDQPGWEFPFLQGWVMGQTQAGLSPLLSTVGGMPGMQTLSADVRAESQQLPQNHGALLASAAVAAGMAAARVSGRSAGRHRSRSRVNAQPGVGVDLHIGIEGAHPSVGAAEAAAAQAAMAAAAAAAAAELPCTVKLRIWPHDIKNPSASLDPETCRLTIPHAVLCSEMGAHFSPCGRFLAACVACVLPQQELEVGMQSQSNQGFEGMATSPTRHPVSAQHVVYELRIYSLEEATFGEVLASRAIRAAHCLTSIQFSPTSAHILLAYGRRHNSLLRSILVDGTTTTPIYTILEVYKVSDMQLVRVLPSAEDEVNVACFHPLVGGGLVYGTKEGRLRIFLYNKLGHVEDNSTIEQNVFELG